MIENFKSPISRIPNSLFLFYLPIWLLLDMVEKSKANFSFLAFRSTSFPYVQPITMYSLAMLCIVIGERKESWYSEKPEKLKWTWLN